MLQWNEAVRPPSNTKKTLQWNEGAEEQANGQWFEQMAVGAAQPNRKQALFFQKQQLLTAVGIPSSNLDNPF
eukprot:1158734-Pelagomonas_calceolata.AAC.2